MAAGRPVFEYHRTEVKLPMHHLIVKAGYFAVFIKFYLVISKKVLLWVFKGLIEFGPCGLKNPGPSHLLKKPWDHSWNTLTSGSAVFQE